MSTCYLCTTSLVPPGFVRGRPEKRDLLRGLVVLFAGTEEEGLRMIAGYENRTRGVLVAVGDTVRTIRRGHMLWQLTVLESMIPHVRGLVEGFIESIALGEEHYEENLVIGKEVERLRDVLSTTREHYNLVTDRLREKVGQVSQLNASLHAQVERLERMEVALRESEQDLAITLDSIADAVVATDAEGRVRRMNPVAEELIGLPRREGIGRDLADVLRIVDGHTREPASLVTQVQRDGKVASSHQSVLVAGGGAEHIVAHTVAPLRSPHGARGGVVVVVRDVTEQVRLEEHVRQAQRMDALGQLAGGVAHDFNNVVGGILAFCELLRARVRTDDKASQYVESVMTAAERAAGLTRQLLAFARKTKAEMRSVDVHRIVDDALQLASRTFDRRIVVETKLDASPATIFAEPSLVQTVLLNLLLNARDAMLQGGRILVSTASVTVDGEQPRMREAGIASGPYVLVAVLDTGEGMRGEILSRIFEPFFTTKGPDKGTGLGLAAVYGIMRDHGGGVIITSEVGRGTTVRLYFPAAKEAEEQPPLSMARIGDAHLLLVEDDALLRVPLAEGFTELGYTITEAKNGAEAVALVRDAPRAFDLALVDMNMPVMNGRDALVEMRRYAPHLTVIVLSGYLPDDQIDELLRLGAARFVQKPCRLTDLSQHVSALLPRSARARA